MRVRFLGHATRRLPKWMKNKICEAILENHSGQSSYHYELFFTYASHRTWMYAGYLDVWPYKKTHPYNQKRRLRFRVRVTDWELDFNELCEYWKSKNGYPP